MNENIDNLITDEQINDLIRKLNNTNQQATAINSSTLSSTLSSLAQVALDNQKTQVDALAETLSLAYQEWIESLTKTFEIISDITDLLDITHNPSILQEPISSVIDSELLNAIPQSLKEIEGEISELTESSVFLRLICQIQILLTNSAITSESVESYLNIIYITLQILQLLCARENPTQIINLNGDINIDININDQNVNDLLLQFINENALQEL